MLFGSEFHQVRAKVEKTLALMRTAICLPGQGPPVGSFLMSVRFFWGYAWVVILKV